MGAPRTGATDLQPADARYPGSPLRLERGWYGEQAYAESKNRHPDPHTRPIHLHCTLLRRPGEAQFYQVSAVAPCLIRAGFTMSVICADSVQTQTSCFAVGQSRQGK